MMSWKYHQRALTTTTLRKITTKSFRRAPNSCTIEFVQVTVEIVSTNIQNERVDKAKDNDEDDEDDEGEDEDGSDGYRTIPFYSAFRVFCLRFTYSKHKPTKKHSIEQHELPRPLFFLSIENCRGLTLSLQINFVFVCSLSLFLSIV